MRSIVQKPYLHLNREKTYRPRKHNFKYIKFIGIKKPAQTWGTADAAFLGVVGDM